MENNRKGWMTMEMMAAVAVLMVAMMPLLTLQIRAASSMRSQYHDSVLSEMMTDRLAILREGGWEEYGLCEGREIALYGRAAEALPEGRLKLSVRESEDRPEVREIILCWTDDSREVERKTAVFVNPNGRGNNEED